MLVQVNFRRLLILNGIATTAAGVVLFLAPNVIGGAVGIHLERSAYFVYYLLGGSELGLGALAFLARGLEDAQARRTVSLTFIIFHAASGLAGVVAYFEGVTAAVLWNVLLRGVMIALFLRLRE
jgi:hypothetical protein